MNSVKTSLLALQALYSCPQAQLHIYSVPSNRYLQPECPVHSFEHAPPPDPYSQAFVHVVTASLIPPSLG